VQLGLATVGAGGAFVEWWPGSLQCLLVGYGFLVSPSAVHDSSAQRKMHARARNGCLLKKIPPAYQQSDVHYLGGNGQNNLAATGHSLLAAKNRQSARAWLAPMDCVQLGNLERILYGQRFDRRCRRGPVE